MSFGAKHTLLDFQYVTLDFLSLRKAAFFGKGSGQITHRSNGFLMFGTENAPLYFDQTALLRLCFGNAALLEQCPRQSLPTPDRCRGQGPKWKAGRCVPKALALANRGRDYCRPWP